MHIQGYRSNVAECSRLWYMGLNLTRVCHSLCLNMAIYFSASLHGALLLPMSLRANQQQTWKLNLCSNFLARHVQQFHCFPKRKAGRSRLKCLEFGNYFLYSKINSHQRCRNEPSERCDHLKFNGCSPVRKKSWTNQRAHPYGATVKFQRGAIEFPPYLQQIRFGLNWLVLLDRICPHDYQSSLGFGCARKYMSLFHFSYHTRNAMMKVSNISRKWFHFLEFLRQNLIVIWQHKTNTIVPGILISQVGYWWNQRALLRCLA